MPQPTTTIRIPQPCAASWDAMTPATAGRHCAACQKTVVDFTRKTDAEILLALRQAAGETCGRLRADQVGRPLVIPTAAPRWRIWLGAALALAGILGAGRVAAQARANYYAGPQPLPNAAGSAALKPTSPTPAEPAELPTAAGGLVTIRGTVSDASTPTGLPGASVQLQGTDIGTSTDGAGNFSLSVPAGQPARLVISSVGYSQQELLVAKPDTQQLAVALHAQVLGALVIVQPWPLHPRSFFAWSKYWLTKPFRRATDY